MKNKMLLYPFLAIAALVLAILACGSDNAGTKVDESSESSPAEPPKVQTYAVGDVVQVKDQTITMNSAEFQGNTLVANFTIANSGSDDMTVSTMLMFNARDNEGSKLEEDIFDCNPSLGGTVLPGDKIKGNVCYTGVSNASSVKIYYEASLFGSGAVVWEITK